MNDPLTDHLTSDDYAAIGRQARVERGRPLTAAEMQAMRDELNHDCDENAVPYESDGALGHGWECGICGNFLQAG